MTSLIRRAGPITRVVPLGDPIGFSSRRFKSIYTFNGDSWGRWDSSQWAGDGFPQTLQITIKYVATGATQYVLDSASPDFRLTITETGRLSLRYEGADDASYAVVTTGSMTDGQTYTVNGRLDAGGVTVQALGETVVSTAGQEPALQKPFTHLGVNSAGGSAMAGAAWGLTLNDQSPIHGREYQVGDGTTVYGDINTPIRVDGSVPFTVAFDWEGNVQPANQAILSQSPDSPDSIFKLFVEPDGEIALTLGESGATSTARWQAALANVADMQPVAIKIEHVSGSNTILTIDGVVIPKSSGNISSRAGTIGRIGANVSGNEELVGAIANLEITATPPPVSGDGHGFIDYGSGHPDILDEFSATSSGDMGSLAISSTPTWDSVKGVKQATGVSAFLRWDTVFTNPHLLRTYGYTLSFEVESALMAQNLTMADPVWYLSYVANTDTAEYIGRSDTTKNWVRAVGSTPVEQIEGFKTTTLPENDYIKVDISVDTAGQVMEVYFDRFLVGQFTITDLTLNNVDIYLGGNGNFFGLGAYNQPYYVRNVTLSKYPIKAPSSKSMCWVGDSITQYGQYQLGPTTENFPPYTGYDGADYAEPACQAVTWYLNQSGYANCHRVFSDKGVYIEPAGITTMGAGGRSIYNWEERAEPETWDFDERWGAITGTVGDFPTPGLANGRADLWIVHLCSNDVRALNEPGTTRPDDETIKATARATYKTYIDNIIATGVEQMYLFNGIRFFRNLETGEVDFNEQQYTEDSEMFNDIVREFDGYGGVCVYVDTYTGLEGKYYLIDGLHYNGEGYEYMMNTLANYIPDTAAVGELTYKYPLQKDDDNDLFIENIGDSGAAFNGLWTAANWVDYPENDRLYPMHEGDGAVFSDSKGPIANDITIVNYNPAYWSTRT